MRTAADLNEPEGESVNYINTSVLQSVGEETRAAARSGLQLLTAREIDVLKLIVNAQSSRETAHHLGISPRTVEVHRRRIMRKIGARNIADLVRIVSSLN